MCLPSHIYQTKPTNQSANQRINQRANWGQRHTQKRKSTSLVCLAIPALNASLGSVTDTLNCNWDCADANDFPVAVEHLDVHIAITQGTIVFCEEA